MRAGRELCDQGLHAELSAYDYHAFVDFREIVDDEHGTWGKLCHALQGRPVENLDEELKQVRHATVINRFRTAVHSVTLVVEATEAETAGMESCTAAFRGPL